VKKFDLNIKHYNCIFTLSFFDS